MKRIQYSLLFFVLALLLTSHIFGAAGIRVTSPNGGENWLTGSTHKITWTGRDLQGTVRILLTRNKLVVSTLHSRAVSYTGYKLESYDWTIPSSMTTGAGYGVKVECRLKKGTISDASDQPFSLNKMTMQAKRPDYPKIRVLAPNGGETIEKTRSYRIRWNSNRDCSTVKITILKNETDELKIYNMARARGPYGSGDWIWDWAVPRDLPDGMDYKVKVEAWSTSDKSDNNFTLTGKKIEVFSPRSGDVWYRTQNQMITFRCTGITQNLKIWAAGYPHYPIARNVRPSETGVMWTNMGIFGDVVIPTTDRIYVETMDGIVRGESGRFSFRNPTVEVSRPANDSRLEINRSTTIRWAASHVGGDVNIVVYSSPRSGGAWTRVSSLIASNTANDGSHTWRVTLTADVRYKIRVESVRQPFEVFGESGIFTIFARL